MSLGQHCAGALACSLGAFHHLMGMGLALALLANGGGDEERSKLEHTQELAEFRGHDERSGEERHTDEQGECCE